MDYEKAYKEALNWMRSIYPTLTGSDKEDAEHYFPELAESEDERIRKFLVKHISEWIGCIEHDLKISTKDVESEEELARFKACLAYLEKQKEQKLTENEDERIRKALIDGVRQIRCKNGITQEQMLAYLEKQKEQEHICDSAQYEEGFKTGLEIGLRKQKEQKPVEIKIDNPNIQKIDPDVKISTSDSSAGGDELLYVSQKSYNIGRRNEKAEQNQKIELLQKSWYTEGYYDREFNNEPKWIIKTGEGGPRYEENPKYGQHIEKQDYSGLNDFERAIHRGFLCAGVVNVSVNIIKETAQDCLAHLPIDWSEDFDNEVENVHKRYPEVSFAKLTRIAYHFSKWANRCKGIEWSEKDEKMLNNIEYILHKDVSYTPPTNLTGSGNAYYTHQTEIDWLKSLRPSWKPSEDEERLINTAISFLKDFADKGYENAVECIDWLKSKLNGNSGK